MKIVKYNNKNIAKIYNHTNTDSKDGQFFIDTFLKNLKETDNGYLGFESKKYLRNNLIHNEVDKSNIKYLDNDKLTSEITKTIEKCYKKLKSKRQIEIHILPTKSKFIKEKMSGVSGFTPYKDTCILYMHEKTKLDKKFFQSLHSTIAHEYNHAIWFENFDNNKYDTILSSLVMEGLAQKFEEEITNKKPRTVKFNEKKAFKLFYKYIEDNLDKSDYKIYNKIFFGSKDIPIWTGYTVGYHIIDNYLDSINKKENWSDLMKEKPQNIINHIIS